MTSAKHPDFFIPLLPSSNSTQRTRVIARAAELPEVAPLDRAQLEHDVQLIEVGEGAYCLNHALRLEQIFGGAALRQVYERLRRGETGSIDETLLAALIKHGFIALPGQLPDREHRRLMGMEENRTEAEPSLTLLRILLTDICNLACSYCKVIPNVHMPIKQPTNLSRLEEVIKFFFRYSEEERPKIIHVTGGEPTIHFDHVQAIVAMKERYQRQRENVWLVLGTNATLIDDERARFLADHDVKCIVSMDGPAEIHDQLRVTIGGRGSWQKVHAGIQRLKHAGAEVSISMVLGQHTIEQAHQIIEWLLEEYQPTGLGVNFMKPPTPQQKDYAYLVDADLYANTMYGIHKAFRDRGLFLELVYRKLQPFVQQRYRFHDCGAAGGTNLNVDAKGNVGPCKSFLVMKRLALSDLDARAYGQLVIDQWRQRSPIYYEWCDGCGARGMCGNGCAYDALIHSGDEMDIDIRSCTYTKRFHQLFLEDLFEQIRPESDISPLWWRVPSREERYRLLGKVSARPHTLSYSIGHQTMD